MTSKKLTVARVADLLARVDDENLTALLTDVYARLNAQARVVRELGADSTPKPSEALIRDSDGAPAFIPVGQYGNFVPNDRCYNCNQRKPAGRNLILCLPCAQTRQRAIRHADAVPRYTMCGNCGGTMNGATMPICGKCRVSYRRWQDKQK